MAKAVGQFTIIDLNDITISSTAPAVKIVDMIWLDTSVVPNQLKKWSGTAWINVGDRNADININSRNLLLQSGIAKSGTSYLLGTWTLTEDFISGTKYTIILEGTKAASQYFGAYMNGGSGSVGTLSNITGTNLYKLTFTAIAPTSGNQRKISIYNPPSSTNAWTLKWIAMYKGADKIPLDWTPAPEDTDQKFTQYSTTTQMNAAIVAKGNEINLATDTKITTAATTINQTTDEKLEDYSTTNETTAAINLKGAEIDLAVSQKIIGTYYQEATPAAPKNKEIWYKTEHSNYIVNNMSMSVNSLTGVTVNELTPVQKLYRYNGTAWQLIEDSDITNVKADIAGINISVDGIVQKVEDSEGRIGLVELTSSQLSVDVANVKIRADTLEANINSLNLNIGTLTARIDTAQVDIGTLNTNIGTINTNIGTLNANINSIKLVTNSIEVAVNNSKLQFGSDGLTIMNSGFRIMEGNTTLLSSTSGNLYLRGEVRTGWATLNGNGLYLQPYQSWDGNPSGGRIYFNTSVNQLYIDAIGWGIYLGNSDYYHRITNVGHTMTGNLNLLSGDLSIRGEKFVKKRLSDLQPYHYVLSYYS